MLQRGQTSKIKDRMTRLSRGLAKVTSPRRISGKKSDIEIWRVILKMVMDSNILVANPGDMMVSEGGLCRDKCLMALQNDIARRRLVCKIRNALRVSE
jgi:hypothetical protein